MPSGRDTQTSGASGRARVSRRSDGGGGGGGTTPGAAFEVVVTLLRDVI